MEVDTLRCVHRTVGRLFNFTAKEISVTSAMKARRLKVWKDISRLHYRVEEVEDGFFNLDDLDILGIRAVKVSLRANKRNGDYIQFT